MRLIKIKDATQLGGFGDFVELQVVDGNVEAVIINDCGQQLRITTAGAYSNNLSLTLPEPKQEKPMWRIEGTFMGMAIVPPEYDEKHDAEAALRGYIDKAGMSYSSDDTDLRIVSFTVLTDNTKI